MSLTLRYKEEVFCDIQEIRCQLSRYESTLGDRFSKAAYRTFSWIVANPFVSRVRPGIQARGSPVACCFRISESFDFYLVADDHALIWRVLHGSRDLSQILND
jgi:hypothetical protein